MDDALDRPRGVLTEADRRFLLGKSTLSHEQSRRNAEARIRNRVVNAVKDFALLAQFLKGKDRRQVFEKNLDDPEFRFGLVGMFVLAYLGTKEVDAEFETFLVPAIQRVEEGYVAAALNRTAEVDVAFDVTLELGAELSEVAAAIEAGETITTDELYAVLVGSPQMLSDVESLVLGLGESDLGFDEPVFVVKLTEFLDADLEWMDDDTVRVGGIADSFGVDPPLADAN